MEEQQAPAENASSDGSNVDQMATSQEQPKGAEGEAPKPTFWQQNGFFIVLLAAVWLWFLYSMRKNKRKAQSREDDMNALTKGAKVITIGRMHGTVVKTTPETVTLKPDDKKDYTMTFDRQAIFKVISPDDAAAQTETTEETTS